MLETIEEVRNYGTWFFLFPRKSWWTGYDKKKWTCDLCGKVTVFNLRQYSYGGWDGTDYSDYPAMLSIEYGKYNKRTISICATHTDAEIGIKLAELEGK